jgi:hypothetical protein
VAASGAGPASAGLHGGGVAAPGARGASGGASAGLHGGGVAASGGVGAVGAPAGGAAVPSSGPDGVADGGVPAGAVVDEGGVQTGGVQAGGAHPGGAPAGSVPGDSPAGDSPTGDSPGGDSSADSSSRPSSPAGGGEGGGPAGVCSASLRSSLIGLLLPSSRRRRVAFAVYRTCAGLATIRPRRGDLRLFLTGCPKIMIAQARIVGQPGTSRRLVVRRRLDLGVQRARPRRTVPVSSAAASRHDAGLEPWPCQTKGMGWSLQCRLTNPPRSCDRRPVRGLRPLRPPSREPAGGQGRAAGP